jgi:predicted transcriptional regulator
MTSRAGGGREPTRQRLAEEVARRPGSSIRELADALGIRRTAIVHHLRLLGRSGRVRCVRAGRRVLVFPPAESPFEGLVGLVRLPTVQALVRAVQADPGLSVRGLARAVGITPRAVRYHLLRLGNLGMLEMGWGIGGRRVVQLHPAAVQAIQPGLAALPPRPASGEAGDVEPLLALAQHPWRP